MPKSTRQYWRQNATRAVGHIDDIQHYAIAIGEVFLTEAVAHFGDDQEQWPADYKAIITGVDVITELCQTQRDIFNKMLEIA